MHPSRRLSPARTIAGGLALLAPMLLSADARAQGLLTVTPPRAISTTAGTGSPGYTGNGGPATSAVLAGPEGAVYDSSGNLYLADTLNNVIRKVDAISGVITTVAGTGVEGYSGDGGAATSAMLAAPKGLALDSAGNLYIADAHNHVVRKVSAGTISTVAGNGAAGFGGDGGSATTAQLADPQAVAVGPGNVLYIADTENQRVRQVASGTISTIAGNGVESFSGDGGPATNASLDRPTGIALDSAGNLYIADANNSRVREVSAGTISTVAGSGVAGFSGDGGPAANATFSLPRAVAFDGAGNLYIADAENERIREVAGGTVASVSGTGVEGFGQNGSAAAAAELALPWALALDSAGDLLAADRGNNAVRLLQWPTLSFAAQVSVTSAAQPVVLANSGSTSLTISSFTLPANFSVSGGTCTAVPITLASGASCSLQVVFQPAAMGMVNGPVTFAGTGLVPQTILLTGTATAAPPGTTPQTITFPQPATPALSGSSAMLTASASSNLAVTYSVLSGPATVSGSVVSYSGPGSVMLAANQAGDATYAAAAQVTVSVTVVASGGSAAPSHLWILNADATLVRTGGAGSELTGIGTGASFSTRGGIAADGAGNLWWVTTGSNVLNFVPDTGTGPATYTGGGLNQPAAVAVDGNGSTWVANAGSSSVSWFSAAGTALSGPAGFESSTLGTPSAIAIDNAGGVWVTRRATNTVTRIFGAAAPVTVPLSKSVSTSTLGTKP